MNSIKYICLARSLDRFQTSKLQWFPGAHVISVAKDVQKPKCALCRCADRLMGLYSFLRTNMHSLWSRLEWEAWTSWGSWECSGTCVHPYQWSSAASGCPGLWALCHQRDDQFCTEKGGVVGGKESRKVVEGQYVQIRKNMYFTFKSKYP